MIFTSKYISLTAPTAGRGESGLFASGKAAQKKLYTAEHIPSSPGEGALFFPLLPLPHAAAEIPSNLPGMAHSATVGGGHHCPIGNCKISSRSAPWASSTRSSLRPGGSQMGNLMKPYRKVNHGPIGQLCTKGVKG